jgi:hypothetical protein
MQRKITEAMYTACILSTVHRKLTFQFHSHRATIEKLFVIKVQAFFNGFGLNLNTLK